VHTKHRAPYGRRLAVGPPQRATTRKKDSKNRRGSGRYGVWPTATRPVDLTLTPQKVRANVVPHTLLRWTRQPRVTNLTCVPLPRRRACTSSEVRGASTTRHFAPGRMECARHLVSVPARRPASPDDVVPALRRGTRYAPCRMRCTSGRMSPRGLQAHARMRTTGDAPRSYRRAVPIASGHMRGANLPHGAARSHKSPYTCAQTGGAT